jgi:Flp pilus assembly protein TadG
MATWSREDETVQTMRSATKQGRVRTDSGVAAVEFAIVALLLFTLIFAIVVFGVLFGYRQQLTQATGEGARAAVSVAYTTSDLTPVQEAARTQVNRSLSGSKRQCPALTLGVGGTLTADGIQCSFIVYPCTSTTAGVGTPTGSGDCLLAKVVLDNDTKPLVVSLPLVSSFMPKTLTGSYIVKLSGNDT